MNEWMNECMKRTSEWMDEWMEWVNEMNDHNDVGGDDHDHDEHGMAIHVEGVSEGSTTFTLMLMHDGHSDFTSLPVDVNVVAVEE